MVEVWRRLVNYALLVWLSDWFSLDNNNLESIDIDYVPEQAGISAFMLLTQFELLSFLSFLLS